VCVCVCVVGAVDLCWKKYIFDMKRVWDLLRTVETKYSRMCICCTCVCVIGAVDLCCKIYY
jgi:hypothetical protein